YCEQAVEVGFNRQGLAQCRDGCGRARHVAGEHEGEAARLCCQLKSSQLKSRQPGRDTSSRSTEGRFFASGKYTGGRRVAEVADDGGRASERDGVDSVLEQGSPLVLQCGFRNAAEPAGAPPGQYDRINLHGSTLASRQRVSRG